MAKNISFKFSISITFLLLIVILSIAIFLSTPNITFGNDFYVFHSATQALFQNNLSPYSEQVETANQFAIYGRLAEPGENLMTFSYPPYALLPFLPLAFLPLKWAQSIWVSLLFTSLLILPIFTYPRIPRWAFSTAFLFYPITFSLILGNFAILLGTIIILILGYLLNPQLHSPKSDLILGTLLAFSTIKPQFSALFILFILLFAIRKKQYKLLQSFLISFLAFLAFSFILLPSWPVEWYHQLIRYSESNQAIPHITIFFQLFTSPTTANILAILITTILFLTLAWMVKKWWQNQFSPIKLLAFIGFLTYTIHPRTVSYEQMVFLVPFLIWIFSNPPSPSTLTKLIFYFSAILISWAGFFAAKAVLQSLFPLEWIFIFYIFWMIYIFLSKPSPLPNAVHPQNHDSTGS
jgi:hypothetical protein